MPQKVKIQTGFSEKTSENYNSTSHSISLEMDCNINGSTQEIEDASSKLFALCRKIVSVQRAVSIDNLLKSEAPKAPLARPLNSPASLPSANSSQSSGNGADSSRPATAKQIKYLLELAKKSGMDEKSIRAIPTEFKKTSFESLSSAEASKLIESFSQNRKAA